MVWSSSAPYGGSYGIFGQRYDSAGVPLGGEFRVDTSGDRGVGLYTAVAYDPNGEFVVAWSGRGDGSRAGVFGRRYDGAGVPQTEQFQINAYTTGSQGTASVAATGPGQFVAVWESDDQDGSGEGVFGRRLESAEEVVSTGGVRRDLQGPAGRAERHRLRDQSSASAAKR